MSGILSGESGQALVAAIRAGRIHAGSGIEIASQTEEGTFLRARAQTEGEFAGVESTFDESLVDVTVDNPFGFRVVWMAGSVEGLSQCTVSLLWGAQGVGSTPVDFGGTTIVTFISGDITRFECSQVVPALGYLQINTIDSDPTGIVFDLNYRIHYVTT